MPGIKGNRGAESDIAVADLVLLAAVAVAAAAAVRIWDWSREEMRRLTTVDQRRMVPVIEKRRWFWDRCCWEEEESRGGNEGSVAVGNCQEGGGAEAVEVEKSSGKA